MGAYSHGSRLLEVGRSNVVRLYQRTFRGASSGRSESCLEVSKVRASVIGLTVAYVLHQINSRYACLPTGPPSHPRHGLCVRWLRVSGCPGARQAELKGPAGLRLILPSYTEPLREREVERIESGAPKAKRIRRALRLMDGMIGGHCGDSL